jgi:hypothetical protein
MNSEKASVEKVVRYDSFNRPELYFVINGLGAVRADSPELSSILSVFGLGSQSANPAVARTPASAKGVKK